MPDSTRQTILIVDDHEAVRKQLYWALEDSYRVLEAASSTQALAHMEREEIEVVLSDLHLPPILSDISGGLLVLEAARKRNPPIPVIVVTGSEDRKTALEVVGHGAYGLFQKPFDVEEVGIIVRQAAQHHLLERENTKLRTELRRATGWQEIVGESQRLRRIFEQARAVADTNATVLITGESGTGKEVLARAIHRASPRAEKPFIACAIAALPENLIESELFGHEKGAFTGATSRRQGRFELADGGTLFLDEIGELTPSMQVKLLRVLQERQFERIGGKDLLSVDIRVMAATNRNLEKLVDEGTFRSDLYYRLNVISLELPPLRERADDIPMLAAHFARKAADKHGKRTPDFTESFVNYLIAYHWPGNIRELENVIERAVVISSEPVLDEGVLPEKIIAGRAVPVRETAPLATPGPASPPDKDTGSLTEAALSPDGSFETAIINFKRRLVQMALRECKSSRSEAALRLKISRQYLHRLINELHVEE
ncbi:MAG TPA: sigma-54 dependent transcriptional regulator [Blastocatellia bacterium]|nr:sigma-54 dependent transcriptional regulator [Blastocatellia bacterium]